MVMEDKGGKGWRMQFIYNLEGWNEKILWNYTSRNIQISIVSSFSNIAPTLRSLGLHLTWFLGLPWTLNKVWKGKKCADPNKENSTQNPRKIQECLLNQVTQAGLEGLFIHFPSLLPLSLYLLYSLQADPPSRTAVPRNLQWRRDDLSVYWVCRFDSVIHVDTVKSSPRDIELPVIFTH